MSIPNHILTILAKYGITEEAYDRSVAVHEAAHACLALHFGAPVEEINLNSQDDSGCFSRATTVWQVGKLTNKNVLAIIAAGCAAESQYADENGMPDNFIDIVIRNERVTFDSYIDSELTIVKSLYDKLWTDAIKQADILLERAEIKEQLLRIKDLILDALSSGHKVISVADLK